MSRSRPYHPTTKVAWPGQLMQMHRLSLTLSGLSSFSTIAAANTFSISFFSTRNRHFRIFVRRTCTVTLLFRLHPLLHAHITSGVILMVRKIPHCWIKKKMGHGLKLYAPKTLSFQKRKCRIVSMGCFVFCSSFSLHCLPSCVPPRY